MGQRKHETNYGGLLLRGNTWHMRFSVKGQTVAESTHTSNRREAERILAKRRADLVQQVVLSGKKPIKVHDAIDKFVKSRAHMASAVGCEQHMRGYHSLPNSFLDRISDQEMEDCISTLREKYAESTLRVSVSYFNAMLKYLDELGYTTRKKIRAIKKVEKMPRWLTKEEYARLLAALNPELGVDAVAKAQKQENDHFVRLLYLTGGRYSEVADMKWNQVDFENETVLMIRKKGSITNTIKMSKELKEILLKRRALEKGDVVFSTKQRPNNEGRWFKAAVRRAKLDESQGRISIHTIRHTRCCHLLQDGLGLLQLSKWIGHKSLASTLIYANVATDEISKKVVDLSDA